MTASLSTRLSALLWPRTTTAPVAEDALLVPRAALAWERSAGDPLEGGRRARARLASGAWRQVTVSECSALLCVVHEGLEEGQRLASATGRALEAGAP